MLAKSKPHEVLGIDEWELEALRWVRGGLNSGAIPPEEFDMGATAHRRECGTVGCLGAHMALHAGMSFEKASSYVRSVKGPLKQLFFPHDKAIGWYASPKQAVEVVDHFLETGEVDWNRASLA